MSAGWSERQSITAPIEAAGTTIAVTRRGRGPAIVCLHAVGHGAQDYSRMAERLGDAFELIAIDWPGHGASPRDVVPTSAERYAELLAAILDRLGLPRVALLGNSIGGAAAIRYAATHPDRVSALVLCNPAGLQRVGFLSRIVCRRMASFFRSAELGNGAFERRFRRYYEREVLSQDAAHWRREEIVASARQSAPVLCEAWESFARRGSDIRHLASQLRCPVLFAWATGDRFVAWSRSRRAAAQVPNHTVVPFEGHHAPFLEQPERFERALIAFLHQAAATARWSSPRWSSPPEGEEPRPRCD